MIIGLREGFDRDQRGPESRRLPLVSNYVAIRQPHSGSIADHPYAYGRHVSKSDIYDEAQHKVAWTACILAAQQRRRDAPISKRLVLVNCKAISLKTSEERSCTARGLTCLIACTILRQRVSAGNFIGRPSRSNKNLLSS
jgi:hypothetical protein